MKSHITCFHHREMVKKIQIYILTMFPVILVALSGCTPMANLIIENQTDQVLTLYIKEWIGPEANFQANDTNWNRAEGTIGPGEQLTTDVIMDFGQYAIKAETIQGEIFFSEIYSLNKNLQKIESRVWKAVIPPPPPVPIRVQNHTTETLDIYINNVFIGEVASWGEISNTRVSNIFSQYWISANDRNGITVYDNKPTDSELNENDYLIIIQSK